MDFKIWLYIIIGAIYLLSRLLKKKEAEPEKTTPKIPGQNPAGSPRPLTFEELLKEITEAKQPPKPVNQPQSKRVDYDEEVGEEEQSLETVNSDYRINEVYEQAKRQAFERPSLEETMNVRNTVVDYGKFKVFDQGKQQDLLASYAIDLQDPEGLKKAFVLSEILNRKF
jgi:hypothetical protein